MTVWQMPESAACTVIVSKILLHSLSHCARRLTSTVVGSESLVARFVGNEIQRGKIKCTQNENNETLSSAIKTEFAKLLLQFQP